MVKASDIRTLMEGYLTEKKLDHLEAFYMWSKGITSMTIAPFLRIKYGSDIGYTTVIDDISKLKITRNDENAEDTQEPINMIIENIFNLKCLPDMLDQITEKYKVVTPRAKYLLLALIRSGLFEQGEIDLKLLQLAYQGLFGKPLDNYTLSQTITDLERIGIVYGDRTYRGAMEKIRIPKFVYALLPEIEAKLPHVEITNVGKE